ncbi:MAG: histidine kinase [Polaromonas sp.]|uniref:sensor histidine kinase n=1 Tax=Polaromonas sp. TaxID=1869339 RepID=UPI00273433B4|nr:cache domain-containing protein [Polaromonas sp.]MDP2818633.1 histidine kinase [Polaromonas sp.]
MPRLLRYLDPRRSLASALGWLVVALFLVFALVAALWLGGMARTSLLQQHGRQLALSTGQLAAELDQALALRLQSIRAVATMLRTDLGSDTPRALRAVLDDLRFTYPEFEWIGLADAKGTVVAASGGLLEGSSVAERPGFARGLKGAWIGDAHGTVPLHKKLAPLPGGEAHRFVDMMTPVRNPQGRVVGVVDAELSLRWIRNYVQGLRETLHLPSATQALVLDKDGLVLIGPDALQGKRWHGTQVKDIAFVDATQAFSGASTATSAPALERLDDGQVVLVARAEPSTGSTLRTLGWRVLLAEPADRAYQRADALWLHILWVSLGLGGSAALLGVLIARHLTRRLTALTRSVQDVGRGKAQRIEVPSGIDEVARVGAAFANVLGALQLERSELRTLSAELEQRVATRTREVERLAKETRYAAVVRERLKIARDLHDTLAHSMMAMLTEVRLLKKLHVHDPAALPDELAHAEQAAHQGLKEARAAITQLRFNAVRDVGLGAALADAIKLFSERTGLAVDYSSEPRAASFADERAETLFRIVEEALRNVERHAMASLVRVSLRDAADGRLELRIEDDGVGFDSSASHPGHYGLVGLREQAQLIGAELSVQSAPHEGTTLRLALDRGPNMWS